jgi:ribonuclease VapC
MIVDTSAIVAILRREPEAASFQKLIAIASEAKLSAASYLEACIVITGGKDDLTNSQVDEIIVILGIEIIAFTLSQAKIARTAYAQYGKGSGHLAKLNFGDCFAYALAKERGEPLLFKGNDFAQTDITSAL